MKCLSSNCLHYTIAYICIFDSQKCLKQPCDVELTYFPLIFYTTNFDVEGKYFSVKNGETWMLLFKAVDYMGLLCQIAWLLLACATEGDRWEQ